MIFCTCQLYKLCRQIHSMFLYYLRRNSLCKTKWVTVVVKSLFICCPCYTTCQSKTWPKWERKIFPNLKAFLTLTLLIPQRLIILFYQLCYIRVNLNIYIFVPARQLTYYCLNKTENFSTTQKIWTYYFRFPWLHLRMLAKYKIK